MKKGDILWLLASLLFAVTLVGLYDPAVAAHISCPAEMSDAVLDTLYQKLHSESYALHKTSGTDITNASVANEQKEIDCIRSWSEKHTTGCARSAYTEWLDYYQGELDEAKHELATRSEETADNLRRARVMEFERKHLIPKPPQCPK